VSTATGQLTGGRAARRVPANERKGLGILGWLLEGSSAEARSTEPGGLGGGYGLPASAMEGVQMQR
jgi:hypothetical protein